MKPWVKTVRFGQPLRAVRLRKDAPPPPDQEAREREREQAAFERGRQAGEHALSQQLLQQRLELQTLQQGILTSLSEALPRLIRDYESSLVDLALETARKLVNDLPISVEMVQAALRQALAQVQGSSRIQVFLHAEDLAMLKRAQAPELLAEGSDAPIRFASAPEVTRGGCLVQTRFGTLDARRETKLALLRESVQEALSS